MFRALLDTVPDAMVVVDAEGRLVYLNNRAADLFGYRIDELLQQSIDILLPEAARAAHRRHRAAYVAQPRVREMGSGREQLGRRRDGSIFPVEIALSPIAHPDARLFVASIRDVSETQRSRQAQQRARHDSFMAQAGQLALESPDIAATLRGVPELARAALQVDAVAVLLTDGPQRDLALRAASGLTPAMRAAILAASDHRGALARQLAVGQTARWQRTPEVFDPLLQASDCASIALAPLFDLDRPMGALLALAREPRDFDRDAMHFLQSMANLLAAVVQRDRTAEQLAHAQRLEAVGQLTGGIAHDFNNLLTVISGNLQLLEDLLPDGGEARECVESAMRAVQRGADLTRHLLGFARRQHLHPRALDPRRQLDDLGSLLRRTLGERIHLQLVCADTLPPVYADPTQLDAALMNLALNARDAMPAGGHLRIAVDARRESADRNELAAGDYVVFTVEDDGCGMPPEVQARALEPFYTTKEDGRGSGLGLSMVYGFVKQSGGQLSIHSEPGRGTHVVLQLPAAASGAAAEPPPRRETLAGHERVLVVEDEADVARVADAFLRGLGYRVEWCGTSEQALQRLRDGADIDLLFTDLALDSGMSGAELAHRARERHPGLRVLLTSGHTAEEAGSPRGIALLRKPYTREELAAAIRHALDAPAVQANR